jgi:toxin ParE1/3/4
VPESGGRRKVVLAPAAQRDIRDALKWSVEKFGARAAVRYRALLKQALRDIAADSERPGSEKRPELAAGVRAFHLRFSRNRGRTALGIVQNPRHFVIYRCRPDQNAIDVVRVLHDARDLARHLPGDERRSRTLPNED